MANFDRIKGALYGVAVGDALGGPLEFLPRATVRRRYPEGLREMIGGGWLHLRPGETTDDTAMTLCVADGILEAESRTALRHASDDELASAIGSRFICWLDGNPPDVGDTCREAIARAEYGLSWGLAPAEAWFLAAGALGPNQEGNGALMRCAYAGLWNKDPKSANLTARLQSHLTHSGKQSETCCGWYATVLWSYTFGLMDPDLSDCPAEPEAVSDDWSPSGYVMDTLHAVILAMQEASFETVLVKAVNFGGDADTVGAIAGGLAGAKYGFSAIPERWVFALSPTLRDKLDELARYAYENRK
nr:MAG TPA: hypothetical protein [Caudoviricetes sp.]